MHDIFLSYASAERPRAETAKAALESQGQSVWIDQLDGESPTGGGEVPPDIPRGQEPWEVIRKAIEDSAAFLVLDSVSWRSRDYCRRELEHARAAGKRIVAVTEPDAPAGDDLGAGLSVGTAQLGRLPGLLEPGQQTARAHARLLAELRETASGRWRSWLEAGSLARDARLLIESPLPEFGLTVTPEVAALCRRVLGTARQRRRTVLAGSAVVLVVLATLATLALVARRTADTERAHAAMAEAHALSLLTAQRAEDASSSAQALSLAQQAIRQQDNAATKAAMTKIRSSTSYRLTAVVPEGPSVAAAVADNGRTVLDATRSSVLIVRPDTGTTTTVSIPGTPARRLAITPDGDTGYLIDSGHRLLCLDVGQRKVTTTPVSNAIDLHVDRQGTLWWLTEDGEVRFSRACPATGTAVASRLRGAVAFDVVGSPPEIFTLTSSNVVNRYGAARVRGHTSYRLLSSVALSSLRDDGEVPQPATPDDRELPFVTNCGPVVHVLAGVRYSLLSSTHAAFSVSGRPLGPRTSNLEMMGVGCGPGRTAWAVPLITPRAIALPGSGDYPIGEIDERDANSADVIANSPDSTHTVVTHGDGRVDILTVARTPWGTTAGSAVAAAPVRDGIITIDKHGTAQLRKGDSAVRIGEAGGVPVPQSAGLGNRAYFGVGARVIEVSRHEIRTEFTAPGPVTSLGLSASAHELVAGGKGWWLAAPLREASRARPLTMPRLARGDHVFSVQGDGDRFVETTTYGRLLLATPSGRVVDSTDIGVAGGLVAAVLPDRTVVAMGADGLLRRYSPSLTLERTVLFGAGAIWMQASANGRTLVVGLNDFSVWAVDARTLQALNELETRSPDVRLVTPRADGRSAVALLPAASSPGSALLETIPVGG